MTTVEPIRNKQDLEKIKNRLLKTNFRDYVLFLFGINTGLRISDILNLDVKDVKNKNFIQIKEQKTGKIKKFPINKYLKVILKTYTKDKQESLPLFKTVYDNRMDRITAYRIINKVCKNVHIEANIGTHTLRKTFGYFHYKTFKDVAMLQKIFNHSSPEITLKYIGIEQEEIFKSYNNFFI